MSWLSIVLLLIRITYYAIKYEPEIAAMIKNIIDLIRGIGSHTAQAAFAVDLDAAVKTYKLDRNERPLRDLLSRVLQHCNEKS